MAEEDNTPHNSNEIVPDEKSIYVREMTIRGVFMHIKAIINMGREEEFLKECGEAGYTKLAGPEGIIKFTRQFIAERAATGLSSDPIISSIQDMVETGLSPIDHCDC